MWSGPGGPLLVTSLVSTPMGVDRFIVSYFSCVFKGFLLESEQFRRQVENVTTQRRLGVTTLRGIICHVGNLEAPFPNQSVYQLTNQPIYQSPNLPADQPIRRAYHA